MGRPTITDLAAAANVSVSTVDRVLNGRDPVRQATAEAVLEAAVRIGFHGVPAIRSRLAKDKPARRFGFLLQQSHRQLYQLIGKALKEATGRNPDVRGTAMVEFLDDLAPANTARALLRLGRAVDAVAVITADQPIVSHAIETLQGEGKPVFALISDLTAPDRAGYVGADNWKLGRTAGWLVRHLAREPGKVATFVGSHRYLSQDISEAAFRSYIREHADGHAMIDTLPTQEEPQIAYGLMRELLDAVPDLAGLFVAGGGISGVMRALRAHRDSGGREVVVICRDMSSDVRDGLATGLIKASLCHPLDATAERLVRNMVTWTGDQRPEGIDQSILPFHIVTAENV